MKIFRFAPDLRGYAQPRRVVSGRWWPKGIDLGPWLDYVYSWDDKHQENYDGWPSKLSLSDFPWLSLQVPVVSERAAERLGFHPERAPRDEALAGHLRPLVLYGQRFFAVQPMFAVRGEPHAFVPEASQGIAAPGGEILHYHTRVFEPDRIRGEFFTIPAHEPFADTYVTGSFVDRARDAGLTGLDHLELVFDDGPVAPSYPPASQRDLDDPSFRQEEEWYLFRERGAMSSYLDDDLRAVFDRAVLDGLMPIHDP
ncbi:MAG TPA: hypothetical protein VFP84_15180 [Kofleriaceae bacterium]|nr:hypothetical protein [Kofleriaceae bacterium]